MKLSTALKTIQKNNLSMMVHPSHKNVVDAGKYAIILCVCADEEVSVIQVISKKEIGECHGGWYAKSLGAAIKYVKASN